MQRINNIVYSSNDKLPNLQSTEKRDNSLIFNVVFQTATLCCFMCIYLSEQQKCMLDSDLICLCDAIS